MELEKTKDYKPYKYSFDEFNPVQTEVLHLLRTNDNNNLTLSANTSSGKTICAEFMIDQTLELNKKVVYLSPLKSLADERYEDWQNRFPDREILILTSDYANSSTTVIDKKLRDSDILILTSEMLDHKTRTYKSSKSSWLKRVGLLIVDESHIIGSENRGAAVEVSLMRFSKLNKKARILLLSATMSNPIDFQQWLQMLNGKTTDVVESTWRPVPLTVHYNVYESVLKKTEYGGTLFDYYATEKAKLQTAVDVIMTKVDKQKFLVFVHSKAAGRSIVKLLEKTGVYTVFHNADLPKRERQEIEEEFKDVHGNLRVLVSTSTLAWGVNLPARNVVIVGTKRGMSSVDSLDIVQMAGRAGRYGIDEAGDVYMVVQSGVVSEWTRTFEKPRPVLSMLESPKVLAFHTVVEINNGIITSEDELIRWYRRTLRYLQTLKNSLYVDSLLVPALRKLFMITTEDPLTTTTLGQISSMLYFCPYDIAAWYMNFRKLMNVDNVTDYHLAWALFNVPKNESWVVKTLKDELDNFKKELSKSGVSTNGDRSLMHMFVGYTCLSGEDVNRTLNAIKREITFDFDRTIIAVKLIVNTIKKSKRSLEMLTTLDEVGLQIKYGVSRESVRLVRIPGIGARRSASLIDINVFSAEDIVKSKRLLHENFSDKVGKSIFSAAKKYLRNKRK